MPPALAAPPITKCLESHAGIFPGAVSLVVTTCNLPRGPVVPMPTLPPELILIWSAPLPSRKEIWPPVGLLITVSPPAFMPAPKLKLLPQFKPGPVLDRKPIATVLDPAPQPGSPMTTLAPLPITSSLPRGAVAPMPTLPVLRPIVRRSTPGLRLSWLKRRNRPSSSTV